MSVRVMASVFDRYPRGGGEMLLALSLADHAHDDGTHIYPSVVSLAQKTRQSVRAVQYQLKAMLACGWLELTNEGDGRYGQHREYRISVAWLRGAEIAPTPPKRRKSAKPEGAEIAPSDAPKSVSSIAPVGAKHDKGGCSPLHPSYNRKEPSDNHQSALTRISRAARLTEAWVLPQKFGQWALENYPDWTHEFIRERGMKFRDHWSAIPGKPGLKTDWFATWRNFCLAEAEFIARTARTSGVGGAAWWTSDQAILAEGAKHGLKAHPGESTFAFKGRIQAAIENSDKPKAAVGPDSVLESTPALVATPVKPAGSAQARTARSTALQMALHAGRGRAPPGASSLPKTQ
jgi:hypothetical protein